MQPVAYGAQELVATAAAGRNDKNGAALDDAACAPDGFATLRDGRGTAAVRVPRELAARVATREGRDALALLKRTFGALRRVAGPCNVFAEHFHTLGLSVVGHRPAQGPSAPSDQISAPL